MPLSCRRSVAIASTGSGLVGGVSEKVARCIDACNEKGLNIATHHERIFRY